MSDELYLECVASWVARMTKERCFEAAAKWFLNVFLIFVIFLNLSKCFSYISINDYLHAAESVVKRDTPTAFYYGVKLANLAGKSELAKVYATRGITLSMVNCEWSVGMDIIEQCSTFEVII